MSSGVTLTCLFFASVEAGSILVKIGMTSSPMAATCRPTASIWLVPKFSSFDQMSFTFIGLIPGGSGACFGGEKKSLIRPPNPPKFAPQATASLLFTGLFEAGLDLKLREIPAEARSKGCLSERRVLALAHLDR